MELVRHVIEANGAKLVAWDAGSGTLPFVLVHGLACDHTAWLPQFEDLARDHRCVAIDLRGRGESQAIPPYHLEQQADDVAAVMRALAVGPAIIVGHSLGGIVALVLNERHPDLVMGIAAADSPMRPTGLGAAALVERLHASGTPALEPMVERFFSEGTTGDIRAAVREMMLTCPPEVAAGMLSDDDRVTANMTELVKLADRKPFMAMWAARPAGDIAWLREACMFIRQEPIPGGGHFFQFEKPAITNALLRAFLDDVERDPRIPH